MSEIFVDGHGWCEVWTLPKVAPKKQRRGKYVQESFVHPAKMDAVLCRKIIETYTELGETVLDPMSGIDTTGVEAAYMGRNSIAVELEEKFVKITEQNIGLLEKAQTLTPKGKAVVIKGDSRELSKILGEKADVAVFSPPYVDVTAIQDNNFILKVNLDRGRKREDVEKWKYQPKYSDNKENIGNLKYGKPVDAVVTSPPFADAEHHYKHGLKVLGKNFKGRKAWEGKERAQSEPENIGKLKYGKPVDAIVTSPPFGESQRGGGIAQKGYDGPKHTKTDLVGRRSYMPENVGGSEGNISRMPYGEGIDVVITSPPYEGQVSTKGDPERRAERMREAGLDPKTIVGGKARCGEIDWRYGEDKQNLGNLKGETYLSAMFKVYRECFKTLKPSGKMVLVLKDFVRNKKVVRLDLDTKKLVEGCGFRWVETKLFRLPSKSFWRTLYDKKHPEVDTSLLKYEFVEVFEKPLEVCA